MTELEKNVLKMNIQVRFIIEYLSSTEIGFKERLNELFKTVEEKTDIKF